MTAYPGTQCPKSGQKPVDSLSILTPRPSPLTGYFITQKKLGKNTNPAPSPDTRSDGDRTMMQGSDAGKCPPCFLLSQWGALSTGSPTAPVQQSP